jgi:Family of unknown function (DUF6404)
MTHAEKVAILITDLRERGIKKGLAAPPVYRFLWKFGFHVAPPHFATFAANALLLGIFYAVFWGILMWLLFWRRENISTAAAIIASACFGLVMGVASAISYRRKARELSLPRWEDYPTKTI